MNESRSIAPLLLVIFAIFWLLLAINPLYRDVWVAENLILVICITYVVSNYQKSPFSNTSYWLIFLFCILQTIGAHYTYAEVPFGFWVADLLEIERNHYDRLVHLAFGFFLVLPFKETITRTIKFSSYRSELFLLVLVFFGIGSFYEIVEWLYAIFYEQATETADSFLGSQGDIWDAEKDMLLNGLGAWLYLLLFNPKTKC
ncbi:Predicted membrane protein [hydrothermal vent metagenome]|uniref:Predicted membrane protein n=1 Tax=hydrothermal vent metagenome TaxID=652676 RepID=A0A1W1D728_9ZZZZ